MPSQNALVFLDYFYEYRCLKGNGLFTLGVFKKYVRPKFRIFDPLPPCSL